MNTKSFVLEQYFLLIGMFRIFAQVHHLRDWYFDDGNAEVVMLK